MTPVHPRQGEGVAEAVERVEVVARGASRQHAADLRLILSALSSQAEALEPSGDTKAAYSGEFKFKVTAWRENEDEESDDEWEEYLTDVTVPWTTIKEIMAAIKSRADRQTKEDTA